MRTSPERGGGPFSEAEGWRGCRVSGGFTADPSTKFHLVPLPVPERFDS